MFVDLGNDTIWEISGDNKAILRRPNSDKYPLTIDMTGYDQWYYDNLEDFYHQKVTDKQARVIYAMKKWGQTRYEIIREGKIIFSSEG